MADSKLRKTLTTTLDLLDQFTNALNSQPADDPAPPPDSPSPLPLLSTCAATLRAQTTKLSLLIIIPPFTPSAISTVLTSLNNAILPSLLTATLLLTPSSSTKSYSAEAISLTKATFRDLKDLAHLVATRSQDENLNVEATSPRKSAVTERTGKIWEDCDELKKLADDGIAGFVVKKAEQYLELIKDAVKEIEEWDPEADDSDDDDDAFFIDDRTTSPPPPNNQDQPLTPPPTSNEKSSIQEITLVKSTLLKTLHRIPQSLHVVIAQRLKKGLPLLPLAQATTTATTKKYLHTLNHLLTKISQTSACIDDVAARLYTHDALGALLTTEKARSYVVEIVTAVLDGWEEEWTTSSPAELVGEKEDEIGGRGGGDGGGRGGAATGAGQKKTETKEDRYIARALAWINAVGGMPQQSEDSGVGRGAGSS
jgi:Grap2 and cyclin-D-interacting